MVVVAVIIIIIQNKPVLLALQEVRKMIKAKLFLG